ncbi:hypothetical protein OC844_004721 [Tilletia horrida]|nr:hypothetical protein OC844_004721 [Tilletia horrida]
MSHPVSAGRVAESADMHSFYKEHEEIDAANSPKLANALAEYLNSWSQEDDVHQLQAQFQFGEMLGAGLPRAGISRATFHASRLPHRSIRACRRCRQGKQKCSGEMPCFKCSKRGYECIYEDKAPKPPPSSSGGDASAATAASGSGTGSGGGSIQPETQQARVSEQPTASRKRKLTISTTGISAFGTDPRIKAAKTAHRESDLVSRSATAVAAPHSDLINDILSQPVQAQEPTIGGLHAQPISHIDVGMVQQSGPPSSSVMYQSPLALDGAQAPTAAYGPFSVPHDLQHAMHAAPSHAAVVFIPPTAGQHFRLLQPHLAQPHGPPHSVISTPVYETPLGGGSASAMISPHSGIASYASTPGIVQPPRYVQMQQHQHQHTDKFGAGCNSAPTTAYLSAAVPAPMLMTAPIQPLAPQHLALRYVSAASAAPSMYNGCDTSAFATPLSTAAGTPVSDLGPGAAIFHQPQPQTQTQIQPGGFDGASSNCHRAVLPPLDGPSAATSTMAGSAAGGCYFSHTMATTMMTTATTGVGGGSGQQCHSEPHSPLALAAATAAAIAGVGVSMADVVSLPMMMPPPPSAASASAQAHHPRSKLSISMLPASSDDGRFGSLPASPCVDMGNKGKSMSKGSATASGSTSALRLTFEPTADEVQAAMSLLHSSPSRPVAIGGGGGALPHCTPGQYEHAMSSPCLGKGKGEDPSSMGPFDTANASNALGLAASPPSFCSSSYGSADVFYAPDTSAQQAYAHSMATVAAANDISVSANHSLSVEAPTSERSWLTGRGSGAAADESTGSSSSTTCYLGYDDDAEEAEAGKIDHGHGDVHGRSSRSSLSSLSATTPSSLRSPPPPLTRRSTLDSGSSSEGLFLEEDEVQQQQQQQQQQSRWDGLAPISSWAGMKEV